MRRRLLLPLVMLFGFAGCSVETKSSPVSIPAVEKSPAKPESAKTPCGPRVGQFNLPLEIHIETPEVPPEIQGPSPPIKVEPKTD